MNECIEGVSDTAFLARDVMNAC